MLRVSQLPTFPENLLHLLCESAVINVVQRRTGHHGVAKSAEEAVSIVVLKGIQWPDALCPSTLQRIWREDGASDFLETVDAVGVTGNCINAGAAIERHRLGRCREQ